MQIGMLWFDNDPKTSLAAKIERAAEFHRNKYGRAADMCRVHPSMLPGECGAVDGVTVETDALIRPGHFWIGMEERP